MLELAARDSSKACGAVDKEEAQGLHTGEPTAMGALARARFGSSQKSHAVESSASGHARGWESWSQALLAP